MTLRFLVTGKWGCLGRSWGIGTKHRDWRKSPRPPTQLGSAKEAWLIRIVPSSSNVELCLLFRFVTLMGNWSLFWLLTSRGGWGGRNGGLFFFWKSLCDCERFYLRLAGCLTPNYFLLFLPLKNPCRRQPCHFPRGLTKAAASHDAPNVRAILLSIAFFRWSPPMLPLLWSWRCSITFLFATPFEACNRPFW